MNEKAKYATVLVLAVFVSLSTSYLSTPYFHSNAPSTATTSRARAQTACLIIVCPSIQKAIGLNVSMNQSLIQLGHQLESKQL
jgi:hypothetical protein